MATAADSITRDLPSWSPEEKTIDYYYWYHASEAVFHYDGPNGRDWEALRDSTEKALLDGQERGERQCLRGTCNPVLDKWGSIGGRVYATAINVMTLRVRDSATR